METLAPPPQELLFLAPEILLAVAGLALLVLGARERGLSGREAAAVAGASLLLAGGLVVRVQAALEGRDSLALLDGLFVLDGLSFLVQLLVLLAALVTALLAVPGRDGVEEGRDLREKERAARAPALLLFAAASLLVLASGTDLLVLGLALETAALALSHLAGGRRPARLLPAVLISRLPELCALGLLLAGLALLARAAGSLHLAALGRAAAEAAPGGAGLRLAGWLIAAGLALRIALIPIRLRSRAGGRLPTPLLALLATAFPAAVCALLLRVLPVLESAGVRWQPAAAVLAAAALLGGGLAALSRGDARRLLAAFSLVHAGALLTGLLAADRSGPPAVLVYLSTATAALLGACAAENRRERRASAGAPSAPAAATLLFCLALAGLPPTAGFVGKLGLLAAALRSWPGLAGIGALASALALAAALRRLAALDREDARPEPPAPPAPAVAAVIILCAVLTLALGVVPGPFLAWTESLGFPRRNLGPPWGPAGPRMREDSVSPKPTSGRTLRDVEPLHLRTSGLCGPPPGAAGERRFHVAEVRIPACVRCRARPRRPAPSRRGEAHRRHQRG